jgi:hypothetical protein
MLGKNKKACLWMMMGAILVCVIGFTSCI